MRYLSERFEREQREAAEKAARGDWCQCEHDLDQARISRILGSQGVCRKCQKPINLEAVEAERG